MNYLSTIVATVYLLEILGAKMAHYLKCVLVVVACCVYSALGASLIICEGQSATLSCPAGQVLSVTSAVFGRTRGICVCPSSNVENKNCRALGTTSIVQALCNGRNTCILQASPFIYGDPCPGTFKYLEVDYTCVTPGR